MLLLDRLPMTHASLPDVVRVVWTGKSSPDKDRLRSQFTVRREIVYNALQWLYRHNEDYRQVIIDHDEFARWPLVFVAISLLDSIGQYRDSINEDILLRNMHLRRVQIRASRRAVLFTRITITNLIIIIITRNSSTPKVVNLQQVMSLG